MNETFLDYRADWRKFATTMFKLEDADPGYVLLKRAKVPRMQKLRFVLAWCAFYNVGVAAVASTYQGAEFYQYLRHVYPTAKRNSERRHFRGQAGLKALHQWQTAYPVPEEMVESCYSSTYMGVRKNMLGMAQMGDYFYWKLADVWDTVFDQPVDFTGCEKYMPKVPKQGAEMIMAMDRKDYYHALVSGEELEWVMRRVTNHIRPLRYGLKHPRKLELQEAETVCCVFKQHVVGDYKFGFRSAKAFKRLNAHAHESRVVLKYLDGLYAGGIWNRERLLEVGEHL